MSAWITEALQIFVVTVILAIAYAPLGDYMARVFTSPKHSRFESALYRTLRINPEANQRWTVYLVSVLAFSVISTLLLMLFLMFQNHLPYSNNIPGMPFAQAFNTAVSFVTNTNWQSYSGEVSAGFAVQAAGLAVQNFLSPAVGITVVIVLIRAFVSKRVTVGERELVEVRSGSGGLDTVAGGPARPTTGKIKSRAGGSSPDVLGNNFWVDLTRATIRILLPIATVAAVLFVLGGVIQNLSDPVTVQTIGGGTQTIPGGLVASQEVIKELGTNGGGYFNANSAHPFENPNAGTNLAEILLILLIPFSLARTLGRMLGDLKQGRAIVIAMAAIAMIALAATWAAENAHGGAGLEAAGASMEGKEVRFGVAGSAFFAVATTLTSTGAVDSMHSSYTGLGGGVLLLNMMLGEVAPGGVGSGLYGMLILAMLTVFLAGLMVGRTPTFLGKRLGAREMKLIGGYLLVTPSVLLLGTGLAMSLPGPRDSILNSGPHGLTEVVYAFTSASNNNGSAFAGLNANTDFYNIALAICMAVGRFGGIALVLALAGSLSKQPVAPKDSGTLPTSGTQFIVLLVVVTLLITGLTYVPTLVLGPLAEGLS